MDKLEDYAREKERDARLLTESIIPMFNRNELTDTELEVVFKKFYELGHNAGHCRGEKHKKQLEGDLI